MAIPRKHAEKWRTFMYIRFFPQFWEDIKARLFATLLGVLTAVLILLAQIYFGVITSGVHRRLLSVLWPYALLLLLFTIYHLARTPWLISNEHLDAMAVLRQTISEREATTAKLNAAIQERDAVIQTLKDKPARNAAEERDYNKAKEALRLVGKPGIAALRFLRDHGTVLARAPGMSSQQIDPQLPNNITVAVAFHAFHHCASEGLVTAQRNFGNTEETFKINPKKEKVLDELLFEDLSD